MKTNAFAPAGDINPTCSELVEPISKGTFAQSRRLLTEGVQVELNYSGGFCSVVCQSALRFLWLIMICRSLTSITPLVLISPSG